MHLDKPTRLEFGLEGGQGRPVREGWGLRGVGGRATLGPGRGVYWGEGQVTASATMFFYYSVRSDESCGLGIAANSFKRNFIEKKHNRLR